MQVPYLDGALREAFDHWLEETLARHGEALTFTEIRKGVQALSELYVERRPEGQIAERSVEGRGKRAALATYYAALHFMTVCHAVEMVGGAYLDRVRRIWDLGCGSGAVGAAVALSLPQRPRLVGLDRSGWALDEVKHTWRALGLEGKSQRAELPKGFPRVGRGDLLTAGWMVSELPARDRKALLARIASAMRRGAGVLLLEPLSTQTSPWWPDACRELAEFGARDELIRVAIARPRFIQDMDKAARLDHQVIGARVLAGGFVD